MSEEKKVLGRPTDYSLELAMEICKTIATSSHGLVHLCKMNSHWPCRDTIYAWKIQHKIFSDMYVRAKQHQADYLAEECLTIADDGLNDKSVDDNGKPIIDYDHIQRSKLRVDTRKWYVSKLAPRIYGEKVHTELTGKDGGPVEYANLTDEERAERITAVLEAARNRRDSAAHDDLGEESEESKL